MMAIQQTRPQQGNQQTRPQQCDLQKRPIIDGDNLPQQKTIETETTSCKKVIDEQAKDGWRYHTGIDQGGNNCILVFRK